MKTLVLIRHGKSSWADPTLSDKERPLKKRGLSDGKLILDRLRQYKWNNASALTSPAKRAHTTADIICEGLELKSRIDHRLYFEGEDAILDAIGETANDFNALFCFGHQPNTASLYSRLTNDFLDHIPTTGVAIIDFEIDSWTEIKNAQGQSRALLFPKMFK